MGAPVPAAASSRAVSLGTAGCTLGELTVVVLDGGRAVAGEGGDRRHVALGLAFMGRRSQALASVHRPASRRLPAGEELELLEASRNREWVGCVGSTRDVGELHDGPGCAGPSRQGRREVIEWLQN
jgi:hypothetical protein